MRIITKTKQVVVGVELQGHVRRVSQHEDPHGSNGEATLTVEHNGHSVELKLMLGRPISMDVPGLYDSLTAAVREAEQATPGRVPTWVLTFQKA